MKNIITHRYGGFDAYDLVEKSCRLRLKNPPMKTKQTGISRSVSLLLQASKFGSP